MEQKFTEHLLFGRPSVGDTEMNKEQLLCSESSHRSKRCLILSGDGYYHCVFLLLGGKRKNPLASLAAPFPSPLTSLCSPEVPGVARVNYLLAVAGSLFSQTSHPSNSTSNYKICLIQFNNVFLFTDVIYIIEKYR